jgi:hypothetical protein
MSAGRVDLRQGAVGFVAIVVGVFIALAAETWWQDREEAALERDNLALLADELATIDSTLVRVIRIDSTTAATLGTTLGRIRTGQTLSPEAFALNLEDYRIPTGAARRLLAEPGPILRADARLHTGLSDLEAEISATQDLVRMLTSTTLQDIDGFFVSMARANAAQSPEEQVRILSRDPTASAYIQVWVLALQNRDAIHRRLRALVADVLTDLDRARPVGES